MRSENDDLKILERRFTRTALAHMTYSDALARFTAMWTEARRLNPEFPGDWRNDIDADLVLARILNGLPQHD